MPQVPTARGIKIRSASDAHLLFYAVHLQRLPIIQRRLDATERLEVAPGAVFVWEERSAGTAGAKVESDAGPAAGVISGIERWTDGLKWGPSRVRDDFLFYQEKDSSGDTTLSHPYRRGQTRQPELLVKQTYSVHYYPQILDGNPPVEPPRKWHLTAYQSAAPGSTESLADVNSVPELRGISPPDGLFRKARIGKKRDGPAGSHHSGAGPIQTVTSAIYPLEPYGSVHHSGMNGHHGPPHGHSHRGGTGHSTSGSYDAGVTHPRGGSIPSTGEWRGALFPPPPHSSHGAAHDGYPGPPSSSTYPSAHNTPPIAFHGTGGAFPQSHYQPPPNGHAHSNSQHSHTGSVGYGESPSPYGHTHGGVYGAGPGAYPPYPHREAGYGQRQEGEYARPTRNQESPTPGHLVPMRNLEDQNQHIHPHSHLSGNPANGYETFHPSQAPPRDPLGQPRHPQHAYSYSNGHSIPEPPQSQHEPPQMQHARVDSQPYPHTPQQRPMMPHPHPQGGPTDHGRAFSQPSHSMPGAMDGLRSPPLGVARIRKGARKSEDSTAFRHALSRSPPSNHGMNGVGPIRPPGGSGTIGGEGGRSQYSPYSRPGNAPGPRQHSALGGHPQPEVNPTQAPFDNSYQPRGSNTSYPQQDSLAPLPMRPPSSSHPFATPSVPSIPGPPDSHHYLPPLPPSLPIPRMSRPPQNPVHTYYYPPGPSHDGGTTTVGELDTFGVHDYGRSGWNHGPGLGPAPVPRPTSLQMQSAIPIPAGSVPPSQGTSDAHHPPATETTGENTAGIPTGAHFPGHMIPHPNPNSSPVLTQFHSMSTSFDSKRSGSGGRGGGGGPMNGSPELARLHQHMAASSNGGWDGSGATGRGGTPVPPRLDTTVSGVDSSPISVTAGGSVSGSASSKLGPLTPSTTLVTRDPEDERLLDLLSRGLLGAAGARVSGEGNPIASAGGQPEEESTKTDG